MRFFTVSVFLSPAESRSRERYRRQRDGLSAGGARGSPAVAVEAHQRTSRKTSLSNADRTEFAGFWHDLQTANKKRSLANAIRRFGYAGDRDLPDDRIVDLMIAAESLFLSDESGELSYRLSERFAFFVAEIPGPPRRALFQQVRRAYAVRSSIVHGNIPHPRDLRTLEGVVSVETLVDIVSQLLRLALRKMIQCEAKNNPPDWTQLVFG
jgi:hypothetical protein